MNKKILKIFFRIIIEIFKIFLMLITFYLQQRTRESCRLSFKENIKSILIKLLQCYISLFCLSWKYDKEIGFQNEY